MSTRNKTARLPAAPAGLTPACTREERLRQIEAVGKRIDGHVRFMVEVGKLQGSSEEAKERVVELFQHRLTAMEGQLARILEDFQLE